MKCQTWKILPICEIVAASIALAGCGGSSSGPVSSGANTGNAKDGSNPTSPVPADAPPAQIVEKFLHSLRDGNHDLTVALLTKKSLEETKKHNFSLQQIGTPTLRYEVGQTEIDPDDQNKAQVKSVWAETGAEDETYEVTWVLKKESQGWRICGMATAVFVGEQPILFNFEDGADFRKKWNHTDEEIVRREGADAQSRHATRTNTGAAIDSSGEK